MNDLSKQEAELSKNGFAIINNVFSEGEIQQLLHAIGDADHCSDNFRKSAELFAIRQFIKEVPAIAQLIFTDKLKTLIRKVIGDNYFVVKSIYFDKPGSSNWYVSYHQDLTISVNKKIAVNGYGPWTVKQNQYAVQPPLSILENITTIRIHLDDTDERNGALKVIPGSHLKKIYRPETIDWSSESEISCNVSAGGVMLMKPLLLHSSGRTINEQKRRVIHIELSNATLADAFNWAEKYSFTTG